MSGEVSAEEESSMDADDLAQLFHLSKEMAETRKELAEAHKKIAAIHAFNDRRRLRCAASDAEEEEEEEGAAAAAKEDADASDDRPRPRRAASDAEEDVADAASVAAAEEDAEDAVGGGGGKPLSTSTLTLTPKSSPTLPPVDAGFDAEDAAGVAFEHLEPDLRVGRRDVGSRLKPHGGRKMAMTATAAALETVRRTTTAHLDAVDALERAVGAEMAQLATDRRALDDDRAAFIKNTEDKVARDEEDKARMKAAAPPPDEVVALNVGGAPFKASRAVLARVEDSMLGRLFGPCGALLQADPLDGSIFIDRDGERFGMVLDFLRGDPPDGPRMQRAIRALPEAAQEALVQELDFFGLVTAVFGVPPWTDGAPFRPGPTKSSGRYLDMAQLAADRRALQDDRATMMQYVGEKLARGKAEVDEQRAAVERDRAEFNDEAARMRAAAPPPDEMVKLNVGGSRFETSRAVLTKVEDSMLGRMFSRCDATLQPDPSDGAIFIDRDGERFRLVLDFLRDLDGPRTRRTIRALAEAAQESMTKELDFFGLDTAVFGARPWTQGATFRPGPAMGSGHSLGAAVFAGGRVVVFGGLLDGTHLNTTELLDTQTMAFTAGPNMLTARERCAAVQLDAERVLVVGGNSAAFLKTTEIFHLSTLTFTPGPNMLSARSGCSAVALDARRIVVVGGHDGTSRVSTTEIFSLDTMAFAPGPTMAAPREGCAAVALDEHRIMVAGGYSVSEPVLTTTEVLDVRTMAFAPGPSMSSACTFCAAVPVDAQHVLIIGGQDSVKTLATTELLDVAMLEFSPGPTMQCSRSGSAAACLDAAGDGRRILVLGGGGSTTEMLAVDAQTSARHRR